jgi:hypothetical protein
MELRLCYKITQSLIAHFVSGQVQAFAGHQMTLINTKSV